MDRGTLISHETHCCEAFDESNSERDGMVEDRWFSFFEDLPEAAR
jgi:hypothetical protein